MLIRSLSIALLGLSVTTAFADVVITNDGARLTGEITLIDKGTIHLVTPYAGTLEIKQDQVASFETENPLFVRLQSGAVMAGPVQSSTGGKLKITSEDGVLETNTESVSASWSTDAEDPELVRNRRTWQYEAGLDLAGKTGNVEKFRLGSSVNAELKSPNDSLALYFQYEQEEDNGNEPENRMEGGASYESFFSGQYGWYIRTELEQDEIDEIDLRSTSGFGVSFRLINKDNQSLIARTGIGYEYTAYSNDRENDSSATIDLGLAHKYEYQDIFVMTNNLSYVPLTNDFGDYRIVHDSGVELPIGSGENWKVRFGIKNEYESRPATNERLDTSYYTRMIYSWR